MGSATLSHTDVWRWFAQLRQADYVRLVNGGPSVYATEEIMWREFNKYYVCAVGADFAVEPRCNNCGKAVDSHVENKCLFSAGRWRWLGNPG